MGFIIQGFLGLAILIALVWLALFLRTKKQVDAQHRIEQQDAETERLLRTAGERLYCVACQKDFEGPLPDEGCPHCHTAAFVVPGRLRPQERNGADTQGALRLRVRE